MTEPPVVPMLPGRVTVLTGGHGDDMDATRELLRLVARGEHGPALRLYRPRPTIAFGRRETHHRGYPAAAAAARLHGFEPVVRITGGRAVAYGDGCLIVELIAPDPSPPARLTARFAAFSAALTTALRSLGVDAAVGRLDGEFCPGDFSIIGAGSIKLAGTAQRLVAGAWLCSASITVSGAAPLRKVLVDVYRELEFGWRPETLGSVTDLEPSLTMTDIENAVVPALGGSSDALGGAPAPDVKLGLPKCRRRPRAVSYRFNLDDVAFLRSAAGHDALAATEPLELTEATRLADVKTVRAHTGERFAGAVLETAMLRRRAAAKLDDAGQWLLTAEALQQATPSAVARHRASRLAGRDVHDVTCSIGADLIELARTARRVIGSDLDPVRLAMAAHNLAVASPPVQPAMAAHVAGSPVQLVRADALRPVTRDAVVLADPSRRDETGRRRWHAGDFTPPLDELATVHTGRDLVVKCAPGLDFDLTPWAAEVELVSLDGDVREACLWSAGLATPGVRRRATVLHCAGSAPWTITDADDDTCPIREPGEWIVNPDGAVVRAGLVRQYAARHGLGQLDARIAYLTGDTPPPGTRAFRVLEHGHYTEKALRAALRRLTAGSAEILVRGLDIDPNALRPRLRLRGPASYTVILTRIGHTPTAFICQAERF